MTQYIDKDAVVAEIERIKLIIGNPFCLNNIAKASWVARKEVCEDILSFLDTIQVKEDSLENFKSLQHVSRDLNSTLQDWGYAPNLYFCDGMWHVSWISCEEGDSIKDFEGNTPEEAIDKACNWFHSTFCNS